MGVCVECGVRVTTGDPKSRYHRRTLIIDGERRVYCANCAVQRQIAGMAPSPVVETGQAVFGFVRSQLAELGFPEQGFSRDVRHLINVADARTEGRLEIVGLIKIPTILFLDFGDFHIDPTTGRDHISRRVSTKLLNSYLSSNPEGLMLADVRIPVSGWIAPITLPTHIMILLLQSDLTFDESVRIHSNLVRIYSNFVGIFRDGVSLPRELVRSLGLLNGILGALISSATVDQSPDADASRKYNPDPGGDISNSRIHAQNHTDMHRVPSGIDAKGAA